MEEAKLSGLVIDLTAGCGWPLSTPATKPEDGMEELVYADTTIRGGRVIDIPIPQNFRYLKSSFRSAKKLDKSLAELKCVIAAQILREDSIQIFLDHSSELLITENIRDNRIKWDVPHSKNLWKIIAIYAVPTMEANPFAARKEPILVVNHWDSTKIHSAYNYLFGNRTGLEKYYSAPFRAFFNDSYEFRPVIHFAPNLFNKFLDRNGYDLKPWLPSIMKIIRGTAGFHDPNPTPRFILSGEEERIRYDFNQTMGEILIDQLIKGSNHWAKDQGLLHRTQPYGPLGLDVISGAGYSDIPETEQLYDGGTEGFIKQVTSGAHLYNRQITSQESYVFWQRTFMTTPLKLKALTGKSMTAGVNQIIYHGFPYRLMTDQYGIEGWSPFTTQYAPNVKFSSHINEANPFWSDIKEVNKFISRSQYAMRSGRPLADVLIYYPMVSSLIGPNPEEKLIGGYFDGVEPEAPKEYFVHNPDFKAEDSFFWEVANKLMERGITWDYVNEESLEGAEMHNGKINIRGNEYSAVILPNLNYSTYESARGINRLSKEGANVLIVGAIPSRQPGFYKYKERDKETYSLIKEAVHQKNGSQVVSAGYMDDWMDRLPQKISYKKNYDFLRQAVRELNDGGQLNYLWNMSGEWQNIEMVGNDKGLKYFYWLNPEGWKNNSIREWQVELQYSGV